MSNNDTPITNFAAALFVIAAVAFGLFVFSSFVYEYSHAKSSFNWPHVNGSVIPDAGRASAGGESGKEVVWYEYAVGGKIYRACQEKFFEPDSLSTGQIGQTVKVFYNPKHPQDACLVPGVSNISTARIIAFLSTLFGGIIAIFYFFYQSVFPRKKKFSNTERERVQVFPNLKEWSQYQ